MRQIKKVPTDRTGWFKTSKADYAALQQCAEDNQETVSNVVRRLIRVYLIDQGYLKSTKPGAK